MSIKQSKIRIGYHVNAISIGGSDLYLSQVIKGLDFDKYEIFFFCKHEYPVEEIYGAHDMTVIRFDEKRTIAARETVPGAVRKITHSKQSTGKSWATDLKLFLGLSKDVFQYYKLLRQYRLDIFHSNDGGPEPMILAAACARIPVRIASYCVLPDPDGSVRRGDRTRRFFEKWAYKALDKAIVKSEATKEMWITRLQPGHDKFQVIYNGLNLERFNLNQDKERNRQELGIGRDSFIIGLMARLHPMKGHIYLIDALQDIVSSFPQVKVLFVGDGELREDLERKSVEKNLSDYISFLGYRSDADKVTSTFDAAVLPSISYETFGSSLIEAMAFGIPVVASDFSGIPEVVQNDKTGILVPPGDVQALKEALIKIISRPEKARQMGEAGRRRVEEYFTQDIMLRKTFRLYESLIEKDFYSIFLESLNEHLEAVTEDISSDEQRVRGLQSAWNAGRNIWDYMRKTGIALERIAKDSNAETERIDQFIRAYRLFSKGLRTEIEGYPLSWGHYKEVLHIESRKERDFYLQEAALKDWSPRELKKRIQENYFKQGRERKGAVTEPFQRKPSEQKMDNENV